MWMMRAGRELSVSELAKLLRQNLDNADLEMRHMLRVSAHGATAGFALAGLMASVGADKGSV